ncbi:MAG TPA: PhnD/SsuA/transferrin family substrate-binding protein [Ideonella sp.]|uniref:phosphate/phosphite/phosphonate ABC transporter substrate-binding protein n=1 Tax=Ideonella sp. TaxID=1929293 RepID=UPI002E30F929|nr:PhnD/SsuA/transferrin family substrate-binding protein [Ideonella sp.]HEX5688190.1 PhnD/SsuA/transferrin family substrate-binding protein [Ideonella sp.]
MPSSFVNAFRAHLAALRSLAAVALVLAAGCRPSDAPVYQPSYSPPPKHEQEAVYLLAVHPLHNPKHLFELYQPLMDHLNRGFNGVRFQLETAKDYKAFERKLKDRTVHFALPNPYQAISAEESGYHVFAKMGDDHDFRGLLLVRTDSGIDEPADLVGKKVSYPAPTALAATLLPQRWLHDHGINVLRDLDNSYVGTQESSIMSMALGKTAAAATWPQPWRVFVKDHPRLAEQIEVKWQTMPLVNNALVVRDDVPADVVVEVRRLLVGLSDTAAGRELLAHLELERFEPATKDTYNKVRHFVENFERDVRPIDPL